jgi:hypothetical protein
MDSEIKPLIDRLHNLTSHLEELINRLPELGGEGVGGLKKAAGNMDLLVYEKPAKVAKQLGISVSTLRRRRLQGVFKLGTHYIQTRNRAGDSIFLYNVMQCRLDSARVIDLS